MGCGSSKASTAIVAFGSPKKGSRPLSAPNGKARNKNGTSSNANRPDSGGDTSVTAVVPIRKGSASVDSGIGEESRNGSANLGQPKIPVKENRIWTKSDQSIPRVDESSILASLRQEGLLGTENTCTSKGGICFEVSAEELKVRSRRPPARLQRLEKNCPAENASDQIRQKLTSAEARRRKREKETIQRRRDKDAKNLEAKLATLDLEQARDIEPPPKRVISGKSRRNLQLINEPVIDFPAEGSRSDQPIMSTNERDS